MRDSLPKPQWHIAQSNLKIAPYVACVAAVGGIALGFFVPFYPMFITVAVVMGALTFGIQWLGVRLRTHLGPIGTLVTIFTWMVAESVCCRAARTSR